MRITASWFGPRDPPHTSTRERLLAPGRLGRADPPPLAAVTFKGTATLLNVRNVFWSGSKKENISGLVVDLRRNGGGSLEEAVNLTGLFIRKGPVVQAKDANGVIHISRDLRVMSSPFAQGRTTSLLASHADSELATSRALRAP